MTVTRIPLLAVDGGGTKCLAVLVDDSQQIVGTGRAGSCNYQGIGREMAARELEAAIRAALQEAVVWQKSGSTAEAPPSLQASERGNQEDIQTLGTKTLEIECAVFGLAGLDTEYDRRVITEMVVAVLQKLQIKVRHLLVENDGFAALLGATNGEPGILVIAGTGSIAFGVNKAGETARSGGWGHRVGDEGSGYWIGKQAVTAVLKAADGRGRQTALTDLLPPHIGLSHVEELFNWTYGSQYSVDKIGELSLLVSQAADRGDAVALGILEKAGEELFHAARAVMERLCMNKEPFKMILQGGVLQNDERVRSIVLQRIRSAAPQVVIDKAQNEPIYGVIAKGLAYLKGRTEKH
ncbi:N-acetylglucosamine kinase [Brevibacillus ruminantium]|uniref:N-acetylglucosamine kinase n=1 Tax=Brevibacillus ruminantium TaxID=2950604 RepID=A0ABY4WMI0_9BACL|nr:BadF/BadG/BcrA/BcrD ATPase family protein [Brevibacillus ruminantium]USG68360.1 N-acetylglucosamine kinase [Brevibacillus ruminantium]